MKKIKCMICGRCLQYVRELSAPKSNLRFYTCWNCQISYKLELKEHLAIVDLVRAR